MEAAHEKERGNKAFKEKKFEEAVASFTKCLELDPEWVMPSHLAGVLHGPERAAARAGMLTKSGALNRL